MTPTLFELSCRLLPSSVRFHAVPRRFTPFTFLFISIACITLSVESENVVEDIVRRSIRDQVENLGVRERVVAINAQLSGDKHNDITSLSRSGLGVNIRNLVSDLAKGKANKFLNDSLGTLVLSTGEGEHRVITVEVTELRPVGIEGLVVELAELLGEGVEIDCVSAWNETYEG